MYYSFDTSIKINSIFKAEDYFPAIVTFSAEEVNNVFIEFSYRDTDMFELVGSSMDGIIKQFTLTLCNHFEVYDDNMNTPDAMEGTIFFSKNDSIECEMFNLRIYKNGLRIDMSQKRTDKFLKCGQLIFVFADDESLVSLYVTDLSDLDISHVLEEVSIN